MDVERIATGLTDAQRRATARAVWIEKRSVWRPEGWYIRADKRVRYALCRLGLLRDYLGNEQKFTPLGLAVRQHLIENGEG